MNKLFCAATAATLWICAGCASEGGPGPSVSGWSRDRLDDVSYAAAFDAAHYAARQWFRVTDARSDIGRITTAPAEADERGGGERLRDVVRSRNTIRRQATLRVVDQPKEHQVVVECVVSKQRLDSSDARVVSQQNSFEESPNRTPIQTEAGATEQQREVWTDIGRDRGMERQILDIARDRALGKLQRSTTRPSVNATRSP